VDKYTAFCAAIQEGKEWEGESPPTSRKNTPTSSREIEKRGASTLSSQENSPESPASPEQKEEEAQGARGGESPKKKLQRRRKGTQTKTLGTGSSSEKKEEDPSGKKQTSSEGSQKGREGKRKGDPTAPQREGASRKKGPRKPSSQKNRGASPKEGNKKRELPTQIPLLKGRKRPDRPPVPIGKKGGVPGKPPLEQEMPQIQRYRKKLLKKGNPKSRTEFGGNNHPVCILLVQPL
jgi:hypothetical protein